MYVCTFRAVGLQILQGSAMSFLSLRSVGWMHADSQLSGWPHCAASGAPGALVKTLHCLADTQPSALLALTQDPRPDDKLHPDLDIIQLRW